MNISRLRPRFPLQRRPLPRLAFRATGRILCLAAVMLAGPVALPRASHAEDESPGIAEIQRLLERSRSEAAAGRADEAVAAAKKALAIQREMPDDQHGQLAETLEWLAGLHEEHQDFTAARTALEELLAVRRALHGERHWRTSQARVDLEKIIRFQALRPEQRNELEKAKQAQRQAMQRYQAGAPLEALPLMRQALDVYRTVYGREHPESNDALLHLVVLYQQAGDYAKALPLARQAREISRKIVGEDHPNYAYALSLLAQIHESLGEYNKAEPLYQEALDITKDALGERDFRHAGSLRNLARLYRAMGQYARAEPLYQQARVILEATIGDSHPEYASVLSDLGVLYYLMGRYTQAESLHRQSTAIVANSVGQQHPWYALSINMLAGLLADLGDHAEAERLFRQAVEIVGRTIGTSHPHYATLLNNLGHLYHQTGDYARAEPLLRKAWTISRQSAGERHPETARALANLANVHLAMGDHDNAARRFRQVAESRKASLGEQHPEYAASLIALASMYEQRGDWENAEPLYRQASETLRESLGDRHPVYATSLERLAALHAARKEYAVAEKLHRQALEIRTASYGRQHPDVATSLNHLAKLHQATGRHEVAEALFAEANEIAAEALSREHVLYAGGLADLASLYLETGEYARAETLLGQVLEILERHREASFAVQNERQRIALTRMLRTALDGWLSAAARNDVPVDRVYQRVLRWKGAVFARQREERLALDRPELAPQVAELRSLRSRWATLALATPPPDQRKTWQQQVLDLRSRKEDLESEIARSLGQQQTPRDLDEWTHDRWVHRLPSETAFVDVLQYTDFRRDQDGRLPESRLLAFVIRRDHQPVRIDLGPSEPIARAIDGWRAAFGQPGSPITRPDVRLQDRLVERVWQPLAQHLQGVENILIAPDGPLCWFPPAAFPGERPGSYLIEQFAVGYVTSGLHLAETLQPPTQPPVPGGLLLAGDIDYQAEVAAAATESTAWEFGGRVAMIEPATRDGFEPLPGTGLEVSNIAALAAQIKGVDRPLLLTQAEATEQRIKQELAGGNWRYVHLATHGFFAPSPEPERSAEVGDRHLLAADAREAFQPPVRDPQLSSGLVLAGAARPPAVSGSEDGILTAAEVENLNLLGTELVVLSACQTGLGTEVAGEGILGLQRAFHVAGAQTLVTSLWRVDDAATSLLMEKFYHNLWKEELPRLEALRQAQLFVLDHPEAVDDRRQTLATALTERGIDLSTVHTLPQQTSSPAESSGRSPPALWAAFLHSGRWR